MDSDRNRFAAAILAGGRAVRYGGAHKGLLEVRPGVPIIAELREMMTSSGAEEVIILANDPAPYAAFGMPVLPDIRPGNGPVGGIEAALAYYAGSHRAVLFMPCDLPGMTSEVLRELLRAYKDSEAQVVFAQVGDFSIHPLCAVVHDGLLDVVSGAIEDGNRRVMDIWHKLGSVTVRFEDPTPFFNVNTPDDMALWHAERTGS